MTAIVSSAISRRSLLVGAAGATIAASFPGAAEISRTAAEFRLVAAPARLPIVGKPYPDTDAWCYGGRVPCPEIRLRQGEPVRITVENGLADDTTVHWHGIKLPIAMDGVPGLTQPPIRPGESFTYEFTPPDAGTFWYHPHANSLQQLGRGMAGALISRSWKPFRSIATCSGCSPIGGCGRTRRSRPVSATPWRPPCPAASATR